MFMMDLWYFVFLAPGMLLAMWAQWRVQAAYDCSCRVPVPCLPGV